MEAFEGDSMGNDDDDYDDSCLIYSKRGGKGGSCARFTAIKNDK